MSDPETPPSPEDLGFTGCLEELDRIVRGLETDTVDLDELAQTVARAADLLEWCRGRLGDTRMRLEEVLPRLELAEEPPPAGTTD
ncbi:MAG: exodeoxyribonuclease VII small subunit [Microthrixaceae bacterium]